jgi:antitoxin component YwqK of YwqJK toxin-antitoxin module
MSTINGKPAQKWIKENHTENGLFKVYWKDVISPDNGGASFKDEGEGLRWEWYYEDGKMADGVSKGWYPSGQLKQTRIWKNGKQAGIWTEWYENGQKNWEWSKKDGLETKWYSNGHKSWERTYKDGKLNGLYTWWYENGQKSSEKTYKDGELNGLWTHWRESGQKEVEKTFKDGKIDGLYTSWYSDGKKEYEGTWKDFIQEKTCKDGYLIK